VIYILLPINLVYILWSFFMSYDKHTKRFFIGPVFLFTFLQIIMVNIGMIILASDIDKSYVIEGAVYLTIAMFIFLLAAFLTNTTFSINSYVYDKYNLKPIIIIGYFLTILLLVYFLFHYILLLISIFKRLLSFDIKGAALSLATIRFEQNLSENRVSGIVVQLKNIVLPFLSIYLINKSRSIFIKILVFIILFFILIISGQRWPIFEFLLVLFIFYTLAYNIKFNIKKYTKIALLGFILLYLMSFLQPRFEVTDDLLSNVLANFQAVIYRIFVSQAHTSEYIFRLFPNTLDFGYGTYLWQNLQAYLPGHQNTLAYTIYALTHPAGMVGSASYSTITHFYAEFGWFGLIYVFIFGYLIGVYNNYLKNQKSRSTTFFIMHSFFVMSIATTSLGSLTGIFYHGVLTSWLLYVLINFIVMVFFLKKNIKVNNVN